MPLYSIGHSNIASASFLGLLQGHAVNVLVDVRSTPYSRYNPQFRRTELRQAITSQGIRYLFLGDKLGGQPKDNRCRRADGSVDYDLLAETDFFQAGLRQLSELGAVENVAFMCAEANYKHCHRHWLITRALVRQGITVQHILPTGRLAASAAADFEPAQPRLF